MLLDRLLDDPGRLVDGRAVHRLVDEHDDELRCVLVLPVALRRQLLDVVAHLAYVRLHVKLARVLVAGLDRVEVGGQRHLGVDDDALVARQLDDDVRTQAAVLRRHGLLLGEVAVAHHARHLAHPAQLHLAPAPARVRRPQGGHEVGGLALQLLLLARDHLQVVEQRALSLDPFALQLLDLRVDLRQ